MALMQVSELLQFAQIFEGAWTCHDLLSMSGELVRTAHPAQDWLVLGGGQTVADAAAKVLPKAGFAGPW